MILSVLELLNKKALILASGSPRRYELLRQLGLNIQVQVSQFKEDLPKESHTPIQYVVSTAQGKALSVWNATKNAPDPPDVIIAADTVVQIDGEILEKPTDKEHAKKMLQQLSGRESSVSTGVVIVVRHSTEPHIVTFHETTQVKFAELPEAEVTAYINTQEPYDKAGGYGIQGLGAAFIEKITGDYNNVVGFPLQRFCVEMKKVVDNGLLDLG